MRPTQEHEKPEPEKEQKQKQKAVNKSAITRTSRFQKTLEGAAASKNKNPYGTPENYALFLLTRFIDGLQLRRAISIQAEGKKTT